MSIVLKIYKFFFLQLRVPVKLHAAGSMGHWLRDGRWDDPADDPAEQVALSGAPRRLQGGIVRLFFLLFLLNSLS